MEGIRFQRFARSRLGDASERTRAEKIDHDRAGDNDKGRRRRFDRMRLRADQPLRRLEDHHGREQEQQRRLGKRGDDFDLAVAVLMLGVGRLAGNAHGKIGEQRRREVDQGMAGFGQDRKRAGEEPNDALRRRQPGRGGDRSERDLFLGVHLRPLGRDGLMAGNRGVNARLAPFMRWSIFHRRTAK